MFESLFNTNAGFQRASVKLQISAPIKRNLIITVLHHTMMALGIAAISALVLMYFKPELTDQFQSISPFFNDTADIEEPAPISLATIATDTAHNESLTLQDAKLIGNAKQQQCVTNWLAKRYRVANDATDMLVSAAYLTAKDIKLDPLLILSVMAIESGLNPFAESSVGAQGLMQVMSKVHQEKFDDLGGVKAALNPIANIRVGAQILKEYVTRGGSVEAGLKLYVGSAMTDTDGGYGNKVIAEYRRLKDVANGKNVPIFTAVTTATEPLKPSVIKVNDLSTVPEHLAAI